MPKINLVPIRMTFGRKSDGSAAYPEFSKLPPVLRNNMAASCFIDACGIGWNYDKLENLGTGADHGTACTCVPEAFAKAAAAMFPGPELPKVEIITEAEFEEFYDKRSHVHEPEEIVDLRILAAIKAKKDLKLALTEWDKSAMDPSNPTPGLRKNPNKRWADRKATLCCSIHPQYAKPVAP